MDIFNNPKKLKKLKGFSDLMLEFNIEKYNLFKEMSEKYGWDNNAGYGTKDHIKAIEKFGVTRFHRKTFQPIHKILSLK